jgi:hypothetical protein
MADHQRGGQGWNSAVEPEEEEAWRRYNEHIRCSKMLVKTKFVTVVGYLQYVSFHNHCYVLNTIYFCGSNHCCIV